MPFFNLALPAKATSRRHVLRSRLCEVNQLDVAFDGWDRRWKDRRTNWIEYLVSPSNELGSWGGMDLVVSEFGEMI